MEVTPCPLCGGNSRDKGHGIACDDCGLWLGDGSQARRLGGCRAVWQRRAQPTDDGIWRSAWNAAIEAAMLKTPDEIRTLLSK